MRIQLTLRNKMFLFFSVIMPFGFFFLYAGVFARGIPLVVRYFLGPVLALTVMGSFWGLSAALVMFREQGILRRFHVTPVTPSDMLASSVVANYVLTIPTVLIEFLCARTIFHVTHFGDLVSAFLLITIGTVSFASMGLVVASVTNTMQETQVINQLIWLPLIFLSGATVPLASLPPPQSPFAFWGFGKTKPTGPYRWRKRCMIRSMRPRSRTLPPEKRHDLQFYFCSLSSRQSTHRVETTRAKLVPKTVFPSRLMH